MEEKYKEIYERLKEETRNTIENKNPDKFVEEFKQAVKNRVKSIQAQLDQKKEIIIKMALESYGKDKEGFNKDESDLLKNSNNSGVEDPKVFKSKIKNLIGNLNDVLLKTETLEETIKIFNEDKVSQLIEIKEDEIEFKHEKKLKSKIGKKLMLVIYFGHPQ